MKVIWRDCFGWPPVLPHFPTAPVCVIPAVDVLKEEQLSRNTLFFGEAGQAAIQKSFVVVVGLGGVGE